MTSTCEQVVRLLDLAAERKLTAAESEIVTDHARECRTCAALVRLEQWMDVGAADALEAAVPSALVGAVWDRLAAQVERRPGHAVAPPSRRRHAPARLAFAAVLAAMALLSGWLGAENHRLRARLAEAEVAVRAMDEEPKGPAVGGREPTWSTRGVTAAEVTAALRRVPPQAPVLPASAVRRLLRDERGPLVGSPWTGTLAVAAREGLRAADALALLADLDPHTRLPVSRSELDRLGSGIVP